MMNDAQYKHWRARRLANYPQAIDELMVDIGGLCQPESNEREAIIDRCNRANMAIYRCHEKTVDRAAIRHFAGLFGLTQPDLHLCAHDDGVSELAVAKDGRRTGYVPYSNRSLSWHTDGYYNEETRRINAVVLHCASVPPEGGENSLLDHEVAYILLRDQDPRFIEAFEHPACMTIPANHDADGETRPEVTGPVFSYGDDGRMQMRYSARKRNIRWRQDSLTSEARHCLAEILADESGPVLRYRLKPGEGLISNNVLHNRTAFSDGAQDRRLLYRARFFNRVEPS